MQLTMNSSVKSVSNLIESKVDNEVVLLNLDTNKYLNIGIIGGYIWKLIEKPTYIKDLINELVEKYDVDVSICQNDTIEFLNTALNEKIIEVI